LSSGLEDGDGLYAGGEEAEGDGCVEEGASNARRCGDDDGVEGGGVRSMYQIWPRRLDPEYIFCEPPKMYILSSFAT
jgi:hypothetical protein